jgi:hypothetical protein
MRRAIVFALFGLIASSGQAFAQARAVPRPGPRVMLRPGRPLLVARPLLTPWAFPFAVPWFEVPAPALTVFPPWSSTPWPYPFWNFEPWPTYFYVGETTANHPQLVFNDGTSYTVRDYWRVDDQLHFITLEEGGTKSVEHTVPFSNLDVQRTTEADTARGFRFVVRDEPIEQWLRDHSSAPAPR